MFFQWQCGQDTTDAYSPSDLSHFTLLNYVYDQVCQTKTILDIQNNLFSSGGMHFLIHYYIHHTSDTNILYYSRPLRWSMCYIVCIKCQGTHQLSGLIWDLQWCCNVLGLLCCQQKNGHMHSEVFTASLATLQAGRIAQENIHSIIHSSIYLFICSFICLVV